MNLVTHGLVDNPTADDLQRCEVSQLRRDGSCSSGSASTNFAGGGRRLLEQSLTHAWAGHMF